MKHSTPFALPLAIALAATGACAGSDAPDEDADDHGAAFTFEGPALDALFGPDGLSAELPVAPGFRRAGLLWDADGDGVLEVRTRLTGGSWSAWTAPSVVSAEGLAHAGHVDAFAAGDDGSTPADPQADRLQLRHRPGTPAPTFVAIEPIADIPPAFDRDAAIPDTIDADDGGRLFSEVQATPIGPLTVYSRADWGARAPRCASGSMSPNRFTIHHTVSPTNDSMTPEQRLRQIQAFHMDSRGWCDIGYNYLVSRDGRIWRGRGPTTIGAHVTNNNTGNVGVSFMGTHTTTTATGTQLCNAAKLLRRLHDGYGISLARANVRGHRQYGGTECPGTALYNQIDAILRKANGGCQVN